MKIFSYNKNLMTEPLRAYLLSRALMLFIIILSSQVHLDPIPAREGVIFHPRIELTLAKTSEMLAQVFSSADVGWYLQLANEGYAEGSYTDTAPKNWVFFPILPFLMRWVGYLFGSPLIGGMIVTNFAFLVALHLIYRCAPEFGFSRDTGRRAVWFLCFWPTTHFFSASLTESIFLLLSFSSFLLLERGEYTKSALLMALTSASRPTGMLILPAYAVSLWLKRPKLPVMLTSLAIAPLGLIFFALYIWHLTGHPLAFSMNQNTWGRAGSFISLAKHHLQHPMNLMEGWNFVLLNFASIALAFIAAAWFAKERRFGLALFCAIPPAIAMSTGTVLSVGRFVVALFPVSIFLAHICSTKEREQAMLIILVMFFTVMMIMYGSSLTAGMA